MVLCELRLVGKAPLVAALSRSYLCSMVYYHGNFTKFSRNRKESLELAVSTFNQLNRLLKGREVQFKAVAITALCSYFAQLIGILLHWALWAIALGTILPWIPLLTMKVLWTSKHYGFMAIYLC